MARLDPLIFREIPVIQKNIQDEAWYEGERRGGCVRPNDPVVRENVRRIGRELRETIPAQIAANPGPAMRPTGRSRTVAPTRIHQTAGSDALDARLRLRPRARWFRISS